MPQSPTGVIPLQLILGTVAKVVCSALFVSHRDPDEVRQNAVVHALSIHNLHTVLADLVTIDVAGEAREVTVSLALDAPTVRHLIAGYRTYYTDYQADWAAEAERLLALGRAARTARYLGDQGSAIVPEDGAPLRFTPVPVTTGLPDASTQDWPTGDRTPPGEPRSTIDRERVAAAIDLAFREPKAYTAAVLVVHNGEIVGERYRPGIGPDTQLEAWSMGKSVTATLIGVLIQQGLLALDDPAPVPQWRAPGDPRARITVRDLLQMSSGLLFSGRDDPRRTWQLGVPDHFYIYSEAVDVFRFGVDRPAEYPPGTVGRYHNCDPLALGYIIKRTVTETLGAEYLRWPQAALFDRIGIRRQVLETDWSGNFVLTGFDYGTARNFARLGLLYLRDGVWAGERILPEGWSRFVSTPAPGWPEPAYGGQFWVNRTREFALPEDAYVMSGIGEQHVFIVPSADLVVVRFGHRDDTEAPLETTNAMLAKLMQAVPRAGGQEP